MEALAGPWNVGNFQLRVQLGFGSDGGRERYLVIFTDDQALKGHSVFIRHGGSKTNRMAIRNGPVGVVSVSFAGQEELLRRTARELGSPDLALGAAKAFDGGSFKTSPPSAQGYEMLGSSRDRSADQAFVAYEKYDQGTLNLAFVESFRLDDRFKDEAGVKDETFFKKQDAAYSIEFASWFLRQVLEHKLSVTGGELSRIQIGRVQCRRYDFDGQSEDLIRAQVNGYSIVCVHPDSQDRLHPLMLHIGAIAFHGVGSGSTGLPPDLRDFYKGIDFRLD